MNDERPYRPSNGTEGEIFMAQWCYRCAREQDEDGEYCDILGRTMAGDGIDDPDYPSEWVISEARGPRCKAFTSDPNHPPRCPLTADLFEQAEG